MNFGELLKCLDRACAVLEARHHSIVDAASAHIELVGFCFAAHGAPTGIQVHAAMVLTYISVSATSTSTVREALGETHVRDGVRRCHLIREWLEQQRTLALAGGEPAHPVVEPGGLEID